MQGETQAFFFLQGMMLLLVTKEIHVLSFLVDSKTAAVLKKNLHTGQHNFSATGNYTRYELCIPVGRKTYKLLNMKIYI